MDKLTFKPSPLIKGKFRVVNTTLPCVIFGYTVDLRTVTAEEAEKLVKDGFGYLQKLKK